MRLVAILAAAAALAAPLAHADLVAWKQECGSCHIAYPPKLLSMASWHAVIRGLDAHFGVEVKLQPARRASILAFLATHSGNDDTSAGGEPLLRITETRRFLHEHRDELAGAGRPGTPSPADCGACHAAVAARERSERRTWAAAAGKP
jgi:Dihaem cytochrome c